MNLTFVKTKRLVQSKLVGLKDRDGSPVIYPDVTIQYLMRLYKTEEALMEFLDSFLANAELYGYKK